MIVVLLHYSIIFCNVLETVVPLVVFSVCCRDTTIQQEDDFYLSLLIFLNQQRGMFSWEKDLFLYCISMLKYPQDREP